MPRQSVRNPGVSSSAPAKQDEAAVDELACRQLVAVEASLDAAQHAEALALAQPGADDADQRSAGRSSRDADAAGDLDDDVQLGDRQHQEQHHQDEQSTAARLPVRLAFVRRWRPAHGGPRRAARAHGGPGSLQRLLPKGVLGLAALVFFMGLASAFTGAVLYAYYESRLERTERAIDEFIGEFTEEFDARVAPSCRPRATRPRADRRHSSTSSSSSPPAARRSSALLERGAAVGVVRVDPRRDRRAVGRLGVRGVRRRRAVVPAHQLRGRAGRHRRARARRHAAQGRREELPAELITWDEATDLALLAVDRPGLPALPFVDRSRRRCRPATASSSCRASAPAARRSARASSPTPPATPSSTTPPSAPPSGAGRCSTPTARWSAVASRALRAARLRPARRVLRPADPRSPARRSSLPRRRRAAPPGD